MNRLKNAKSPYLLQHAGNPVDWYPWGEEPFEIARRKNLPVLVSIGYSACHWCHVMARESFENEEVAAFMNEHFINIKVDKEEHPEVDQYFMDALHSLDGSGGWPLNMFVTPNKEPIYGGTYFPLQPTRGRSSWLSLLKAVSQTWHENPNEMAQQSHEMMQHLRQVSVNVPEVKEGLELSEDTPERIAQNLFENSDRKWGGFGEAPKFPTTPALKYFFLYHYYQKRTNRPDNMGLAALQQACLSLDKMLEGGIYDQVGGGFFRYATDAQWVIPHYEKMLYDNAQLISLLALAYRITQKSHYKRALKETLAFCNEALKSEKEPGFYCSLDAESNGEEGAYYTWTMSQWKSALPEVDPAIEAYFGMNYTESQVEAHPLLVVLSERQVRNKFMLTEEDWEKRLKNTKAQLKAARKEWVAPNLDDKMVLSWNALMNKALQNAALALNEDKWLHQAEAHFRWLLSTFYAHGELYRVYKDGIPYISAKLEDWATLINAAIYLSQNTGNNHYINWAAEQIEKVFRLFWSEEKGYFYYSSIEQQDIPIRKIETYDGVIPSGNSLMAENLRLLSAVCHKDEWEQCALKMIHAMAPTTRAYGRSFANWGELMLREHYGLKQLVVVEDELNPSTKEAYWKERVALMWPDVLTLLYENGASADLPLLQNKDNHPGKSYYLCQQFQCLAPQSNLEEIKKELKK